MGLGGALRDSASFPLPMEETKVVTASGEGKQGALLTSSHDKESDERRTGNAHWPGLQRGLTESWVRTAVWFFFNFCFKQIIDRQATAAGSREVLCPRHPACPGSRHPIKGHSAN